MLIDPEERRESGSKFNFNGADLVTWDRGVVIDKLSYDEEYNINGFTFNLSALALFPNDMQDEAFKAMEKHYKYVNKEKLGRIY